MLVKIQISEEEYIYINLSQTITVRFFKENYAYKIIIGSMNFTDVYRLSLIHI